MAEKIKRRSKLRRSRDEAAEVQRQLQQLEFINPGPKALVGTDNLHNELSKREQRKYEAFLLSDARNRRSSSLDSKHQNLTSITNERKREARHPAKPSEPEVNKKSEATLYDARGLLNGKDLCDCNKPGCEGCWKKCLFCRSNKCGPVCRCERNFHFIADLDEIEVAPLW